MAATAVSADPRQANQFGPSSGDRELSVSGAGSSSRNFDNGNFGLVLEHGWYTHDNFAWGIRQSISYASLEGESFKDDYWNGSTRAYGNYQFGSKNLRPFIGGSLGFIYGDGVNNSAFTGAEVGLKYYVLPSTYILGRVEYQWFFDRSSDADVAFRDGAYAHTLGIGYNF